MRYSNLNTYNTNNKSYYGTFNVDIPNNQFDYKTITYNMERLDYLADKFYNDGTLWWIIAMFNNITNPLIVENTTLNIPTNYIDIINYINYKNKIG